MRILLTETGITARPGFTNTFTLTGNEGISTGGTIISAVAGTCPNGLAIDSDFKFAVDAKATQWWSGEIYSVSVPIIDECYSWK